MLVVDKVFPVVFDGVFMPAPFWVVDIVVAVVAEATDRHVARATGMISFVAIVFSRVAPVMTIMRCSAVHFLAATGVVAIGRKVEVPVHAQHIRSGPVGPASVIRVPVARPCVDVVAASDFAVAALSALPVFVGSSVDVSPVGFPPLVAGQQCLGVRDGSSSRGDMLWEHHSMYVALEPGDLVRTHPSPTSRGILATRAAQVGEPCAVT